MGWHSAHARVRARLPRFAVVTPSVVVVRALRRVPAGRRRLVVDVLHVVRVVMTVAVVGSVSMAGVAFAAGQSVSVWSLGAGRGTTASCNATASVSYNVAYSSSIPGYKITTAPLTTAAACSGSSYKVTLAGSSNTSLA